MKNIEIKNGVFLTNGIICMSISMTDGFKGLEFSRPGYPAKKQFLALYSRARAEQRWPNTTKAMFAPMPKKAN
jgi:hypothetical protein